MSLHLLQKNQSQFGLVTDRVCSSYELYVYVRHSESMGEHHQMGLLCAPTCTQSHCRKYWGRSRVQKNFQNINRTMEHNEGHHQVQKIGHHSEPQQQDIPPKGDKRPTLH